MESIKAFKNAVSENTELVQDYAKKEVEQLKLTAFYQLSSYTVGAAKILLVGIFILLAAFFITLALAFFLGDLLGSVALGFLIVAAMHLILGFIGYLMRHRLERLIVAKLSKEYFEDE